MANVIRMKIGGIEYSVTSEDDEAYIRSLGSELERRIDAIQKRSPFLSTTMSAIVAALDCLDERKKCENENEKLRLEIKKLLEETACAKLDADILRRKVEQLTGLNDTGGGNNNSNGDLPF